MSEEGAGRVVETHVSLLVFHDDVVLKYKKPLRLPFLDFSTHEARLAACQAEVEANRRLSPDVYLGVAAVTLGDRVLDHAVVMRRLPADRALAALVERAGAARGQELTARRQELEAELRRLAMRLAGFHAGARRAPEIDDAARPDALRRLWGGCLDALWSEGEPVVDIAALARVDELAMAYLSGRAPLFERRITEARICDGHGDLLADDVFLLDDGPRVLDCLEFDPSLRFVDVIADVVFLVMDLERLGAADLAGVFLDAYEQAAGERFPASLVHHYCAERALVRAEVACLRAGQRGGEAPATGRPRTLVELARAHLEAGRVVLGVISGPPGTGKSSLAAALGSRLGWPVLSSDEIRRELVDPACPGPLTESAHPGAYSTEVTDRTYARLLDRAAVALGLGQSVLLDATFTPARWRRRAEAVAATTYSDLVVLRCQAPADIAAGRVQARLAGGQDVSGADDTVARSMARDTRPWPGSTVLDTSGPLGPVVEQATALLLDGALVDPYGSNSSAKRRLVTSSPPTPMASR